MHVLKMLLKNAADALPEMHKVRRKGLFAAVDSLLNGRQLWLTAIGRGLSGPVGEKHKIKQIDRLLDNPHLQRERLPVYQWLARSIIGSCPRPLIVVDYADLDDRKAVYVLRAAIPIGGRAIPIYELVVSRYNQPQDCARLLRDLKQLLPADCRPILVTDAGFKAPWFRKVEEMGWYYIGRNLGRDCLQLPASSEWISGRSLYARATRTPRALGTVQIPRAAPLTTEAYLYCKPPRGRQRLTVQGRPRKDAQSLKRAHSERAPWLLLSNLPRRYQTAKRVVELYRRRMSIEEGFRDLKAHRGGFALRQNLGRDPRRLSILLMIAAIATLCAWITGMAGINAQKHYALQANTERRRNVLSVFTIGMRLIAQRMRVSMLAWRQATEKITAIVFSECVATT